MYRISVDGKVLYDPRDEDLIVKSPRCKFGVNTVGEASFTILANHPHYADVKKLLPVFEIKQDNQTIFRGRMTDESRDFNNMKQVDLEGAMAYFNDSIIRPFDFPKGFEYNTESIGWRSLTAERVDSELENEIMTATYGDAYDISCYTDVASGTILKLEATDYTGVYWYMWKNGSGTAFSLDPDTHEYTFTADGSDIVIYCTANGYTGDWSTITHSLYEGVNFNIVELFLKWIIDTHNSQVQPFQQFKLGRVTVSDPNNYITRSDTGYKSTWEILKEKLFESSLGGYLCIRYEDDGNYIDYLSDFEKTNLQNIEFGENLLDFVEESDATETYSAIIPLGKQSNSGNYLTIKLMDDGNITDDIVKDGDTLYSKSAVAEYGWIYAPISETTWEDVNSNADLQSKGVEYLKNIANVFRNTTTITAIDLNLSNAAIEAFRIYRYINVVSVPHNVMGKYRLTELDIDIENPQNTKITIGEAKRTFTSTASSTTHRVTNMELSAAITASDLISLQNQLDDVNERIENLPESSASVDIVQTTGTSQTAVMSQKAVTNALGGKAPTSHSHEISDVTGLQTELDNLKSDYGAVFDTFPTETEIRALPNNSFFTVRAHGVPDEQNKTASYYVTTSWTANALRYTSGGSTIYVVPVNQAYGEIYLPYYGIKTGEENAASNSAIMSTLSNSVAYGSTFKFPVGNFYFSEPIDVADKQISILGTASTNHKNSLKCGVTFLHFPNLSDGETALNVSLCDLADFVISGTSSQYNLNLIRDNAFTDVNTVVNETIGIRAYGIKASGGMLMRNVGFKHFYYGCWCDTANMFITDVTFHICHYGLSMGNDSKVHNISGANIMILLQMRGSLASAIGVRGDSVGKNLVEILNGASHTLVDLDADFCMDALVSIGDGTNLNTVKNLSITGIHGRIGVRHFFSQNEEELTANDITNDTADEWGIITVRDGSSLTGAIIITNQSSYGSPFDNQDGYSTPFVLLSACTRTIVNGVHFISTYYDGDELTEDWIKNRISSLSSLPNACEIKVQSSKGYILYNKDQGIVNVIDDAKDIYRRMDKSEFALDEDVVKTVNGIYPDESGNVIVEVQNIEPEVVQSRDDFVDTSKKYVLPDGYIYAHRKRFVPGGKYPDFTNQIPISKGTDLISVYNGVGYKENTDYQNGKEESSSKNNFLSGLIPVKSGDNIYINFFETTIWAGDPVLFFIASDGVTIVSDIKKNAIESIITAGGSYVDDSITDSVNGSRVLSDVRIPINSSISWKHSDVAYVRLCAYKYRISPDDVIVSINEEITYTETEDTYIWEWVNTGELYVQPDYLGMIAELEARVAALESAK